jgi:hypothetical protein
MPNRMTRICLSDAGHSSVPGCPFSDVIPAMKLDFHFGGIHLGSRIYGSYYKEIEKWCGRLSIVGPVGLCGCAGLGERYRPGV